MAENSTECRRVMRVMRALKRATRRESIEWPQDSSSKRFQTPVADTIVGRSPTTRLRIPRHDC